jgi:hypothetical protein
VIGVIKEKLLKVMAYQCSKGGCCNDVEPNILWGRGENDNNLVWNNNLDDMLAEHLN